MSSQIEQSDEGSGQEASDPAALRARAAELENRVPPALDPAMRNLRGGVGKTRPTTADMVDALKATGFRPNVDHRLTQFVSARVQELGPDYGATHNLAAGTMALLVTYAEILPYLTDKAPDYAVGVADGLGQALRYIASGWHQHPDYETAFAVQAPATTDEWVRS
ncbi:hypothetical protein [Streptomyces sp. NPDC004267]|uniref:hypothetical protein n=1 Tax=Streptomyces sp. NPDC004267 TaxID=3364694 RepID=UPI00369D61E2